MSIMDGDSPTGTPLTQFLVQLIVIVLFCRVLAYFFKFLKQPAVIAEVVAGILLGPSAFGKDPYWVAHIFPKNSITTLNVVANIGLIVFMFLVGLELDATLLRRNARNSIMISVVAMAAPFVLGLGSAVAVYHALIPHHVRFTSFLLFVAVALAITAFPVLARILAELRMLDDKVGNIALSSAAVDDVVAWCLLALVVAFARAKSGLSALYTFLVLLGFIAFMLFAMRPALAKLASKARTHRNLKLQVIALLLVLMFVCAYFTEVIGVHAIFGAFLLGIITPRENRFAIDITERIEDLVVIILLPLYFTYSGLRTNLASVHSAEAGGLLVLIIVVACIGKIGGGTLAAKFCHNNWRDSFTVGILMNTKGLVELIVLNLGLDVGVLTVEVFTMFVIMALVTTFLTSPLVHFVYLRHRELHTSQKEKHTMVFFTADQRAGIDMVSFAGSILAPDTATVKAILFNEISDRPSSYFFHLSNKLKQDVPFFKDKAKKDVLHAVKKAGQRYGIPVKTKVLNTVHLEDDVVSTAAHYICEMIVIGVNANAEDGLPMFSTPEGLSINKSVVQMIEYGLTQFMGQSPTSRAIESTLKNVNTQLGIYLSKSATGASIHRVAFLYGGEEFEHAAYETVMRMRAPTNVEIFTAVDMIPDSANDHVNVVHLEDPIKVLTASSRDTVYDLLIFGCKRTGISVELSQLIEAFPSNILVIMPPMNSEKVPAPHPDGIELLRHPNKHVV